MWKKECFDQNRFVETLMYAEEWELYSRIVFSGFNGISIDKCLFYGRKHQNSNTGEFYNNDPVRRKSNVEAILLVIINLKQKQPLSHHIIRYFVGISTGFKEFNLFRRILIILDLSFVDRFKWEIIYYSLYFRHPLYRLKKQIKNRLK
jgi:hypothetical protein